MLFRLNFIFILLSLFTYSGNKFILSTLYIENENIYLSCNNDDLLCEINETRIDLESKLISINIFDVKENDVIIIFYDKKYEIVYKYKLSYLGDYETVLLDKNNYYVGYHLYGLNNKSYAINNLSTRICFSYINDNIVYFKDCFDFDLSFLPVVNCLNYEDFKAKLYIYLEKDELYGYNYEFGRYEVLLNVKSNNEYVYFENISFNFPYSLKRKEMDILLEINFMDVNFINFYNIRFSNNYENYLNYIYFEETEKETYDKKNILHS